MNKLELNDNYLNKILIGKSDVLKLVHKKDQGDSKFIIIVEDQAGEYFQGNVIQKDEFKYVIDGDTEFKRVYPTKDAETGNIIATDS